MDRLNFDEIAKLIPNWVKTQNREAIYRQFRFEDFNEAFAFMTRGALKAETMNHHPEWSNVYGQLDIVLTTHDANGITKLDIEFAQFLNSIYEK